MSPVERARVSARVHASRSKERWTMADLKTTYMGIPLANPLVVGACSLSKHIDSIKALEAAGAGGLVIKSLFEEQIHIEEDDFERRMGEHDHADAEAQSFFPQLRHGGPKEHVFWVKEVRKAVKFPLFASLNCLNTDSWVEYAIQLADTGVNGLELNFYSPALSPEVTSGDIEKREADFVAKVRAAVKLPLAVKLHPFYTSMMNVVSRFEKAGANAFILFNRLFEPDIDVDAVAKRAAYHPSDSQDSLVAVRWLGLLSKRVKADLVGSTGVTTGKDIARLLLAGANSVQAVSAVLKGQGAAVQKMLGELEAWMNEHKFANLAAFRGKLAGAKDSDAWGFERGQYIKAIVGIE
jgi:dihydroorotate dehydrogenase (fumarate)